MSTRHAWLDIYFWFAEIVLCSTKYGWGVINPGGGGKEEAKLSGAFHNEGGLGIAQAVTSLNKITNGVTAQDRIVIV